MMVRVIINRTVELHGNISRNGYENAMIGRYGGCFEEDHRRNIQAKFYNEKFPLV